MELTVSTENPDRIKYRCLALGCFADERPPRGVCGFVDWRLNGMISREIKKGRISGAFEEKIVIPFADRVSSEILLLFGLGRVAEVNYDKIYNAAFAVAEAVDKMEMDGFALELFGEGRSGLVTANIVEALITGIFDFLATDIHKLERMKTCLVTSTAHLENIALGVKQFKQHVNDKGAVDISELENRLDEECVT
jgi:hypothetical protein